MAAIAYSGCMERLGVGFGLHPDVEYLELTQDIIEKDADYFEIVPETLANPEEGKLVPNQYYALFRELRKTLNKPFVAHGLGFSIGTSHDNPKEKLRSERWLAFIRDLHQEFRFSWMTEHLGWVTLEGLEVILPLPLPFTSEAVQTVAESMRLLSNIVPEVGFENSPDYCRFGDVLEEPDFFNEICDATPCSMLLDLHNAYTTCVNCGIDPAEYLTRIRLENVLQIHLSGGSESGSDWLPSKNVYRLDSHDTPVPEEVWNLAENIIPKCPNLRGIVVERLNGTINPGDLPGLSAELRRVKELFPC